MLHAYPGEPFTLGQVRAAADIRYSSKDKPTKPAADTVTTGQRSITAQLDALSRLVWWFASTTRSPGAATPTAQGPPPWRPCASPIKPVTGPARAGLAEYHPRAAHPHLVLLRLDLSSCGDTMIKTLATLTLAAASIAAHAAAVSYGPPTVVQADGLTFVRAAYTERSTVTAHALTSVLSFELAKRADDPDPAVVRAAAIKSIMTVAATTPGCAYIAQPVTVSPNDTPRLRRVEFEQGSNQGSLAEIEGTVIFDAWVPRRVE